jgi:WD40 repeat protein
MINFENENILKTILNSIHLYDRQQISKVMNKALIAILLYLSDYHKFFKCVGRIQHTEDGHRAAIRSITLLANGIILTASQDKTIKFWDIDNFLCIKTLLFDSEMQSIIPLTNEEIAIAFIYQIQIWNASDFKCTNTISFDQYHYHNRLLLLSDGNLAVTGMKISMDNVLILNSHNNYSLIKALPGDWRITSLINLSGGRFAYAALYDSINIYVKTCLNLFGFRFSYFDNYKKVKALSSVMSMH